MLLRSVARALSVVTLTLGCGSTATVTDPVPTDEGLGGMSMSSADVVGIPSTWDRDHLMDDAFFEAKDWATAAEIQRFLDRTVWDRPSWLAKETLVLVNELPRGPIPVAEAIARTAQAHGINPVLLLARMQVEKSLVSSSSAPPAAARRFAFGCQKPTPAYPKGDDPANAGIDVQLECAATTLQNQIGKARTGQNNFVLRHGAKTQDGALVHPQNAATSALYAYTPVEGAKAKNGNWLVWTVTRRFAAAIQSGR